LSQVWAIARRVGAFAIATFVFFHATATQAAPLSNRTRVVLRIEGELSKAQREALAALLNVDFRRRELALSIETVGGSLREWIDRARSDEETLLIAVLDASRSDSWQLTIVDASRGRALSRPLAGGVEANAAALEAVASIVSSAANALKDGLEVASKPIDEVVAGPAKPSAPIVIEPAVEPPALTRLLIRGALAGAASSFANGASITGGFSAAIGLSYSSFTVRIFGARYLPARLDTAWGSFDVHRTFGGISVGPTFRWGRLEIEPEGAVIGELLRRTDAVAGFEVFVRGDRSLHRFGAMIDLRIRFGLGGPFAVEWVAGGGYLAPSVRFLAANPELSELAVPWPWVVTTQLGVEVRAP
jgi:hypothetical protein